MRRFINEWEIRQISEEEIEQIEQKASEGDPESCYKLAQIQLTWRDFEGFIESAYTLLLKAQAEGVIDADVAIAVMIREGDLEPVNYSTARELIEKGLEQKSEYAAKVQIENLIEGKCGIEQNPSKAIEILDELIKENDNPIWFNLKGIAVEMTEGLAAAKPWYEKAVNAGAAYAISNLATAEGYDDNYELINIEQYCERLAEGIQKGDTLSMYLMLRNNGAEWYEMNDASPEEKENLAGILREGFESCATYGVGESALWLGHIYRTGIYDTPVDYEAAWRSYAKGGLHNCAECYEAMYVMLETKLVDRGEIQNDLLDLCAIKGARCGSLSMLERCVELYKEGQLTEYAAEIEQYYLPTYEKLATQIALDDEDEPTDDDGRYDAWS